MEVKFSSTQTYTIKGPSFTKINLKIPSSNNELKNKKEWALFVAFFYSIFLLLHFECLLFGSHSIWKSNQKSWFLVIETSQNCTIKDSNPLLNTTITVMPLHKKRCILPFGHSKYLLENSNHFSKKEKCREEFGRTIKRVSYPFLISKMQCRFCNASFRYLPTYTTIVYNCFLQWMNPLS